MLSAQQQHDDLLDPAEVLGKRIISTRLHGNVTIREATAALEVMSRFATNPKWLIYLPPTMSPCGTSQQPGLLEHPAEAFAYFRHESGPRVVSEEKHMDSRAASFCDGSTSVCLACLRWRASQLTRACECLACRRPLIGVFTKVSLPGFAR